jgi:hypothetical protein
MKQQTDMKNIIKLEEAAMFGLSVYVLYSLQAEWWWYLVLLLGPDISMLGYLAGNKVGAACYNLFHHKGVAVAVFVAGLLIPHLLMQVIGIVLFGHSSMDRLFGYGLKTDEGFKYTHLGIIGKK